jgi:hypothetical protein
MCTTNKTWDVENHTAGELSSSPNALLEEDKKVREDLQIKWYLDIC